MPRKIAAFWAGVRPSAPGSVPSRVSCTVTNGKTGLRLEDRRACNGTGPDMNDRSRAAAKLHFGIAGPGAIRCATPRWLGMLQSGLGQGLAPVRAAFRAFAHQ